MRSAVGLVAISLDRRRPWEALGLVVREGRRLDIAPLNVSEMSGLDTAVVGEMKRLCAMGRLESKRINAWNCGRASYGTFLLRLCTSV